MRQYKARDDAVKQNSYKYNTDTIHDVTAHQEILTRIAIRGNGIKLLSIQYIIGIQKSHYRAISAQIQSKLIIGRKTAYRSCKSSLSDLLPEISRIEGLRQQGSKINVQ